MFEFGSDFTEEHMHAMGLPQWKEYAHGNPFPVHTAQLPKTVKKRVAGNVSRPLLKFRDLLDIA